MSIAGDCTFIFPLIELSSLCNPILKPIFIAKGFLESVNGSFGFLDNWYNRRRLLSNNI